MPTAEHRARLRAQVEQDKQDALDPATKKPIRLGELIEQLVIIREDPHADDLTRVYFDSDEHVGHFMSWRGSYDMLSLEPVASTHPPATALGELLRDARAAVGNTYEGYKGGDYTMDLNTFVWADKYGESPGRAITGATVGSREVILKTEVINTSPAIIEVMYGLTDAALLAKHGTELAPVPNEVKFRQEVEHLINKYSLENGSNTPDFILAQYLGDCLKAFDAAVSWRDRLKEPD